LTAPTLAVGPDGLVAAGPVAALLAHVPHLVILGTTAAERRRAAAYADIAARELAAYLRGDLRCWSVPVAPQGTPFQQAVWAAIARIPYAQVMTYGALAAAIGRPRACRAVAGACGRNPIPIRIPCHRVVATSGPGGYTGGLDCKLHLWAIEGIGQS